MNEEEYESLLHLLSLLTHQWRTLAEYQKHRYDSFISAN